VLDQPSRRRLPGRASARCSACCARRGGDSSKGGAGLENDHVNARGARGGREGLARDARAARRERQPRARVERFGLRERRLREGRGVSD
jgi:hypothetical protein